MAKIERFEDLEVWVKARELTKSIYEITGNSEFARDYGLRDQIRRSAVSIMSNIAEGFERRGDREFRHFLSIAKGSAGELRAQLYIATDVYMINEDQFDKLYRITEEISRMIYGLISYLDKSKSEAERKSITR